jgi:hypothetical protein
MSKSERFKKIHIQQKRNSKALSLAEKKKIVDDVLENNLSEEDRQYIVKSEMPEKIMGVEVDWDEGKTKDN